MINSTRVVTGLCLVYGLVASLHLSLRMATGEQIVPVTMLNQYLPAFWLLALPAAGLCILLRRWRVLALQVPPLLALLLSYGQMFVARPEVPVHGTDFTLLTYNVSKDNLDFESVAQVILDVDADVVAMQEITPLAATYLREALSDAYPHQALHPVEGYPGQGVFSRFPILSDDYWQIELGHQHVMLNIGGQEVALYSVHPLHPFLPARGFFNTEPRTREINNILNRATGETMPFVVAGDFNMSDQTGDYFRITASLQDVFQARGSGFGFTFPSWLPIARLDYMFIGDAITPKDARVWYANGGSDHFPLVVSLALDE